jgi:quinol monooxygenase YgiN
MGNTGQWLADQLRASADAVVWIAGRFPAERVFRNPPRHPERWSLARIIYHLTSYETRIALPTLRQWQGGPPPEAGSMEEDAAREDAAWAAEQGLTLSALIERFRAVRDQQIALLAEFPEQAWQEERRAIWGSVALHWAAAKTLQHTFEHASEIWRMYLWWQDEPQHLEVSMTAPITLIDVFTVAPERQQALVDIEIQAAAVVRAQPGFVSATIHRSLDGRHVANYTQFASREALEAMLRSPEIQAYVQQTKSVADGYEAVLYETAFSDAIARETL